MNKNNYWKGKYSDIMVSSLIRYYFGYSHIIEATSIACTVSFFVTACPVQIWLIRNA
jgi:hypothetical protein